jgi:hypothetical protein
VHIDVFPTRSPASYPGLQNPDKRQLGMLVGAFQYAPPKPKSST